MFALALGATHARAAMLYEQTFESSAVGTTLPSPMYAQNADPGANIIAVVASPTRSGNRSLRIKLGYAPGNERAEVLAYVNYQYDTEYWLGFSEWLNNWTSDGSQELLAQGHHQDIYIGGCISGKNNYGLGITGNTCQFLVTVNASCDNSGAAWPNTTAWSGPVVTNQWVDWVLHFRNSTTATGFYELWRNGTRVYSVTNIVNAPIKWNRCCDGADIAAKMRFYYAKWGIYKWDWDSGPTSVNSRELFLDELRIWEGPGGSYAAVAPQGGSVPSAPTGLIASVVSSNRIDLGWTDNSPNETQFRIERKVGGGSNEFLVNKGAIVGSGGTGAHSDTNLSPATTYSYRVWAENTNGSSLWSNEASATTPGGGGTQFTLIENFDSLTLGNINGQNGWTHVIEDGGGSNTNLAVVATNPAGGGNQVLSVSGPLNDVFHGATITNGTTATLFFQFRFTGLKSFGIGMTDTNAALTTFGFQRSYVNMAYADNRILTYDGILGNLQAVINAFTPVSPDAWHNVWQVINNTTDETTVYFEGALATANASPFRTVFKFRGSGVSTAAYDLINFYVKTFGAAAPQEGQSGTVYIDNIYLDTGGVNLVNPVPPVPAPTLRITAGAPGFMTVSWTPATPGFVLQVSDTLNPPTWTNAPSGVTNPVTIPATLSARFYRLNKATAPPAIGATVGYTNAISTANYSQALMNQIGQLKFLFTHASVGGGMLDGLDALHASNPTFYQFTHVPANETLPTTTQPGVIYEYWRGNPAGGWAEKFSIFRNCVNTSWRYEDNYKVNIAVDKLCFIDPYASLSDYTNSMKGLEAAYPATVFPYVTIPLTTGTDNENYLRNVYNDGLRAYVRTHTGAVLFDLADIEAHDTNGNLNTVIISGRVCQRLCASYDSGDGGHLNALGYQLLARGFYAVAAAVLAR